MAYLLILWICAGMYKRYVEELFLLARPCLVMWIQMTSLKRFQTSGVPWAFQDPLFETCCRARRPVPWKDMDSLVVRCPSPTSSVWTKGPPAEVLKVAEVSEAWGLEGWKSMKWRCFVGLSELQGQWLEESETFASGIWAGARERREWNPWHVNLKSNIHRIVCSSYGNHMHCQKCVREKRMLGLYVHAFTTGSTPWNGRKNQTWALQLESLHRNGTAQGNGLVKLDLNSWYAVPCYACKIQDQLLTWRHHRARACQLPVDVPESGSQLFLRTEGLGATWAMWDEEAKTCFTSETILLDSSCCKLLEAARSFKR